MALWPDVGLPPEQPLLKFGRALDQALGAVNVADQVAITAIRDNTIIWVLRPVRDVLSGLPWVTAVLFVTAAAYLAVGARMAVVALLLLLGITVLGLWPKAMLSLYLVLGCVEN